MLLNRSFIVHVLAIYAIDWLSRSIRLFFPVFSFHISYLVCFSLHSFTGATIQCVEDFMNIDIALPSNKIAPSNVYLDGMKGYPNPRCQPTINNQVASFRLPLKDFYECGVTRIVHKLNVSSIFNSKCFFQFSFLNLFLFINFAG